MIGINEASSRKNGMLFNDIINSSGEIIDVLNIDAAL